MWYFMRDDRRVPCAVCRRALESPKAGAETSTLEPVEAREQDDHANIFKVL